MSWDEGLEDQGGSWSAAALRDDLDGVASALRALAPRVAGLDVRVGEAEALATRADQRALAADGDRRALVGQLRRLAARVEWLERNIRRQGEGEPALQDVPADLRRLARDAEDGRRRSDALLAESVRTTLEGVVAAHAEVVRGLVGHRRQAVAAADSLAATEWRSAPHRAAAADFEAAAARFRALREEVSRLAGPALEAAHDLAQDEDQQAAAAAAIQAGEQAGERLHAALRARLDDALDAGAMLPEWFIDVLGPIAPAPGSAAAEAWREAATDVLAYRVTYEIDDPADALGPAPEGETGPRRRAWYRRLRRSLREAGD